MNIIIKEESVVEFIDQVLENFHCAIAGNYIKTAIELREKLSFLRNFFHVTKDWINLEKRQELLVCVETVVEKIACYSFLSFHYDRVKELYVQIEAKSLEFEIRTVILKVVDSRPDPLTHELLLEYVDCVKKNLAELKCNRNIVPSTYLAEVQFLILQEELSFLEDLVIRYPLKDDGEREKLLDVRVNVEVVARNIGSFVYQAVEKGNKIMSVENGLVPELTDLVEKVKFIRVQVMDTIFLIDFNRFGWKFPQTDRLGNLKYLINNLKEYLMDCKTHDLIMDWKDQVQIILDDLIMFESFLKKIGDDNITLDCELEDLSIRINNSSYEAYYIINSLYARVCPISYRSVLISDFLERMKLIKTDVQEIIEKKSMDKNISEDRNHVVSQSVLPTTDLVIGFEDEMKLLKERLVVSDLKELDVVSIIGMPGLGKTTLANKVYEDPLIASHFQLRAWCCVSQEYNQKDMLLDILSSVLELNDLIRRKSAEDLSVILHKQLTGRRYLILVDDVWNIEAWDDLRRSFPNNNIGSRIMLTSRNKAIGLQAIYHTNPLELRFLTDDESWDLLKAKVFPNKPCPYEFLHVGKKITGKCKGLPLGVVVVAGLLKSAKEELRFWKQVEENLSSHIASDSQGHLMQVLELSYKFLPNYLRPLFLYLGAFPEDKEIPAENLIWLWIAEGFIQKSELMTLEAQARTHLMDLIDRSLLMVAKRSYNGNVKMCRIHDLLHEFCLGTAKKDSFLQQIHVYDESVIPDPIISQWRLSMCLKRTDPGAPSRSITTPLHSFLFFNMNKKIPLWNDIVKSVFCMSKLLSVLHLESTTIDNDRDLMMMVHLRYVSVRVNWESIPSSIFSFWKLETLIIKGVRGELIVPGVIWTMVKLRHLHINDRARFEYDDVDDASKLENLETLSTPAIYSGHEKKLIRRLPNLRKLRCIFFDPRGDWNNKSQFPNLKPFDQVESLMLSYHDIERSSSTLSLPLSLKKLMLSKFRLQWDAISTIVEKLPNLEVLKLGIGSVVGEVWNMGDVEFPNLKFLKLQSLNIKTWNASPENLPALEKLVLERCKQLKEIPDCLGEFYSLEKIELLWCNSSAAKSANQIQDDQKDAGNDLLKVYVYPPDLDL
ncbi:hypothetical protein ACJIZ3_008698 [Penstemon smallii]|uniref:Uncharacterized protein n=1 Tax=Penstemon smallii TaxID=265156 RepID=A0ABD3TC99_9LAMI